MTHLTAQINSKREPIEVEWRFQEIYERHGSNMADWIMVGVGKDGSEWTGRSMASATDPEFGEIMDVQEHLKKLEHTPGPWHPVEYAGYWELQNEECYALVHLLNEEYFPNAKANARLAALAPELLKACIEMLQAMKDEGIVSETPKYENSDHGRWVSIIKKATDYDAGKN